MIPCDFPAFSTIKQLGFDLETSDPYLKEAGPGWGRGVGYVLGVALAVDHKTAWYVPVGKNPDSDVVGWLKDLLAHPIPLIGANLQYDLGWISELGIYPAGPAYDIQFAEALLDDVQLDDYGRHISISLDALAEEYLGVRKASNELEAYTKERWPWQKDFRENLYRCPVEMVARYAKPDAMLPIRILQTQWAKLQREGLLDLFKLECALLPVLVKMRRRGMPVDMDRAMETRDEMVTAEQIMLFMLQQKAGFALNVNSPKDLATLFDKTGTEYARTAKGNPSFTADWLAASDAPIAQEVLSLRKLIKARGTFIENAILDKAINGIIYPSLHPLRNDEGGTVTGRFSCSMPNTQQIPKRDAQWAPIIRRIFIPEEGYSGWASLDYSQIEYRFFAHFANDPGLLEAYASRDADFHDIVAGIIGLDKSMRRAAKDINFGLLYGMGKGKLVKKLSALFLTEANPQGRALEIYNTYNERFPAAGRLMKECAKLVSQDPYEITTILGRKSRFKLWEPIQRKEDDKAYPLALARSKYGSAIKVADTYKAINRKLQGSAADLMKKAMVNAIPIFEQIGYPHITIHDELCLSYHPDLAKGFAELQECMESAVKINVPISVGLAVGDDWSLAK
jgi:DNA polymerase-1